MKLAGLLTAVAAATAVGASAASLGGLVARELGAGQANVLACDSSGVTLDYTVSGGTVLSVSVADVDAACAGGALRVVLAGSSGAIVGSGGPVTVAATTVAVSLSPQPTAASVAAAHVSITGP